MGAKIAKHQARKMSLVGGKYCIEEKIGQGSFGAVFSGRDIRIKEKVAMKLQIKPAVQRHSILEQEAQIYKLVQQGVGFPKVRWFGQIAPFYDVLIMDLLGQSLGDLFSDCGSKFSLKTVLMLADQMISRLEYLHNMNILHRDVKPENFVMGLGSTRNTLYLVDFGLSKLYRDYRTNRHMPYREGKSLTGTARYASLNSHKGVEASRRDDLESVGYVLIYFLRGSLPWQGVAPKLARKLRYAKIGEVKKSTGLGMLCRDCPREFADYLKYCRDLSFTERPDYTQLRLMFRKLFKERGFDYNYEYDWSTPRDEIQLHGLVQSFQL